jgi:peptide/nickel transport system permease protein
MKLSNVKRTLAAIGNTVRGFLSIGPARISVLVILLILVLMASFPKLFTPYNPAEIDFDHTLSHPSVPHPFGTDEAGADILARIVYAARLELLVSGGSIGLALLIGIPLGLLAGYGRRILDGLLSSISAATIAFPLILFAILVVAGFGTNRNTLIGIIGFLFFPRVFLLMRAQTKSLREREFIVAAKVTGISAFRILFRHVVPNATGPILTLIPQLMAEAILVEAGLSYLGLGVQLPDATWGTLLQKSKDFYVTVPSYAIIAGATITFVAAIFMAAGELASESSNPRHRNKHKKLREQNE